MQGRGKNQSILKISEAEAQEIVWKYAGTGVPYIDKNGDLLPREYYSVGKTVGTCYDTKKGEWVDTDRVLAIYSKEGSHIVPVIIDGRK